MSKPLVGIIMGSNSDLRIMKEAAEVFGRGGSHLTTVKDFAALKSPNMVKTINEVMLPALFKKVYSILEPELVTA